MAEEGEYSLHIIADAGGCPNTHDPCYPKGGKGGSPNEGGCPTGSKGKSCDSHGGGNSGDACRVGAFLLAAPALWTPAGWVGLVGGEAMCEIP